MDTTEIGGSTASYSQVTQQLLCVIALQKSRYFHVTSGQGVLYQIIPCVFPRFHT